MRWLCFMAPLLLFADPSLERLTLQRAEEIALECNKQLLIAREATYQASLRAGQAVSRWLPAIQLRAEFRDIQKEEFFFDIFTEEPFFSHRGYSTIFQLSQPLFSTDLLFGLKSSKLQEKAIAFEQANTQNELLKAVRDSYYAVVAAEISLEINRENVDYLTYALKKEEERLEAGGSTPYDVNQNKTAVANAVSAYYSALRNAKDARNALILNLGVDPMLETSMELAQNRIPFMAIPELALKMQDVQMKYRYKMSGFSTTQDFTQHIRAIGRAKNLLLFSSEEVDDYITDAIAHRPDLASKKMLIDVAEQNLRTKQGTYLPQVAAYARYSYNDVFLGTVPFFQQQFDASCGVVLSWNLFDGFLREKQIREARSQRTSSRLMYKQEFQKIEVEIRNGLYQLEEAIFGYLSANEAVLLAEQARFQAQEKLEYGRISTLEYRDSVNQLAQAKNGRNRASFELIAAYYELRFATGADAGAWVSN